MSKQSVWIVGAFLLGSVSWAAAEPPTPTAPPAAQPAPAQPTLAEVLQKANQLLVAGKFEEAEAEFHRAEGLAGGPCGECALGLASVRASEEKWDMTADMIQRALPLLTDPGSLARAYNQLGVAYVKGAGGGGAVSLAKAEDALRNAVDSGGPWGDIARRNLAQVLLLEEHWAEAAQVSREALAKAGSDKEAEQGARIVLCQARSHLPDELPEEQAPPRKVEGGVSRPVKIAGPMPVYTEEARKEKTEGAVIVESIIDREGCVRKVSPLQGLPHGLTEVAVQTLPLWVFSPATFDGKPVAVYYTLTINFKVDNNPPPHPM